MGVPYTFATATTSIPLSQLDANFNTTLTLGNTSVGLGNTVTTIGNLTLTNVTIASGTSNITANSIVNGTSNVAIASSGGAVNIATNGTTALTIDTSQNVTINGAAAQFAMTGNGGSTGILIAPNVASKPTGSQPMIQVTSGAGSGIYGYAGNIVINPRATDTANYGNIYFQTGSTQQNQLAVTTAGNLQFSTSNAGIVFNNSSALTNSTLNDYETGTFTPTWLASGGNPTISGANACSYTKIGRMVFISGDFFATSVSGGSGNLSIGNLPFAATASSTQSLSFGFGVTTSWSSTGAPNCGSIQPSATQILLYTNSSSDARSNKGTACTVSNSGLTSYSEIYLSFCYLANF